MVGRNGEALPRRVLMHGLSTRYCPATTFESVVFGFHFNMRMEPMADLISANAITEINNEPRLRDLEIAKSLGMSRPRDIRKLIDRNKAEFERYGICATVAQNHSGGRGRPSQEYWLNEGQALLVAALSNTPNAADVRHALITVFLAYKKGQLDTPTRKDRQHANRVRQAKLALVSAVNRLDDLGVDVGAIAMPDVLAFSRKINSIGGAK